MRGRSLDADLPDRREAVLARWKLSPESIDLQVERKRRATIVLSGIAGTIGAVFLALFLAFGNSIPALVMNAVLILPVIAWAWVEDYRLHRDVVLISRSGKSGRED